MMPIVRVRFFASLLTALFLAGCATRSAETLSSEAGDPHVLEAELPELMAEAGVPGLTIAVLRGGELAWHGAFGVESVDGGEAVSADTVFEAASLSKPVFAWAVLRLAARGEFDLDAPLWETLPFERLAHDERARAITPRMVLSHQTGLPNWGGDRLELAFDPATSWSYSGEGYVYLAKAVEKATGLALDAFVRREVFDPLGMERSSFVWREDYDSTSATGHDHLSGAQPKNQPTDGNAAASLHTTAADYARFVAAVLSGGEMADRMLEPQAQVVSRESGETVPGLQWGLGWGLQDGEAGRAFWHWGDNGAFRCYVVTYRDTGDGLVYFTNSENGLSLVRDVVLRALPGDEHRAIAWIDYPSHDDPAHRLRIRLERTFLDEGGDAGLRLYRELAEEQPEAVDARLTDRVAQTLLRRELPDEGIAMLEANLERHPDLGAALASLAQANLDAGRLERALELGRQILESAPDDERVLAGIEWARLGLAAREAPVELPVETLSRYAGGYGPRQMSLEDGRLHYMRSGGTKYGLTPLNADTFALDGLPTFRLRFVTGDDGRVVRVEGLYSNGRTDVSQRDP